MEVLLLEKYRKLGNIGDVVNVKNGFARNFLIPNKKAIQATKENKEVFKQREKTIHQEMEKKKAHAEKINSKLADKWIYILKQAGKDGKLYGSVTSIDIVKAIKEHLDQELHKNTIQLLTPIKYIGRHSISVNIFADIYVKVNVIISRTKEEAEIDLKNAIEGKPLGSEANETAVNKTAVSTNTKTNTRNTTTKKTESEKELSAEDTSQQDSASEQVTKKLDTDTKTTK